MYYVTNDMHVLIIITNVLMNSSTPNSKLILKSTKNEEIKLSYEFNFLQRNFIILFLLICFLINIIIRGNIVEHESHIVRDLSPIMRKPAFCICENKDADQLCGNREAVQHLCFCYTDSTIPLLP